jgi:cell wall-associated NlpC family hydrolase
MKGDGIDRSQCPRARYDRVRSRIRSGDILLFQGKTALSRFIRWGSRSTYSHAGMVAWWGRRLIVLHAVGRRGIEAVPVSSAVEAYDGRVDWWTARPELEAQIDRERLLDLAITELGKPYHMAGVLSLAWRMLWGRIRARPDPKADPEAMFCSQYVSYCYRLAGLNLRPSAADSCTSPGDLATSGTLVLRATLNADRQGAPDDTIAKLPTDDTIMTFP